MLFNTGYVDRYQPRTPAGRGGPAAAPSWSRYESSYGSSRQNSRYTPYSPRVNETPARHWKTTTPSYDDKRYYNASKDHEYRRYSPSAYRQTSSRPVNQAVEDDLKAQLQTRRRFSSSSSGTSFEQSNTTDALSTFPPPPPLATRIGGSTYPSKFNKADYHSSSSTSQDLAVRISNLTDSDSFRYVPFSKHKNDQTLSAATNEASMYAEGEDMDEEENEEDKGPILSKEQLDQLGDIVKTMFARGGTHAFDHDDHRDEEEGQESGNTAEEEEGERTRNAFQEEDKQDTLEARLSPPSKSLSNRLSPAYSPSFTSVASHSASSDTELPRNGSSSLQLEKDATKYTAAIEGAKEENAGQYHSHPHDIERRDEDDNRDAADHSAAVSPVIHRRYESQEMSFSSSTDSNETLPRSPPPSSRTLYDRISHSPEFHIRPIRSLYPNQLKSNTHTSYTPDWIKKHEVVMPSGTILCDRRNAAYAAPSAFRAPSTFSSSYIRAEYSKDGGEDRRHRMLDREGEEGRSSYGSEWEWRETAALVGNMVPGVTLGDVRTIFSEFGEIVHVSLIPCPWQDLHQEQPLSTSAMIIYAESNSCRRAVDEMDGVVADDQTLRVEYIRRKDYPGKWPFVVRRKD